MRHRFCGAWRWNVLCMLVWSCNWLHTRWIDTYRSTWRNHHTRSKWTKTSGSRWTTLLMRSTIRGVSTGVAVRWELSLIRAHVQWRLTRHGRAGVGLRGRIGLRLASTIDEVAGRRRRRGLSGPGRRLTVGRPTSGRCCARGAIFGAFLRELVTLSVLRPRKLRRLLDQHMAVCQRVLCM